jgi:hypothetical protein
MKDKNQVSTLLGICIIPQLIAEVGPFFNNNEETAIRELYNSTLYEKLQNPATGLWHLSPKTLAEIFLSEIKDGKIVFPEEQS